MRLRGVGSHGLAEGSHVRPAKGSHERGVEWEVVKERREEAHEGVHMD